MTRARRGLVRTAAVGLVAALAASTALAQRGGYQASRSYSGNVPYDGLFVFVRMSYPWGFGRQAPWAHDWPLGEEQFLKMFTALSNIRAHTNNSSIMSYSDPEMFRFPVVYMVEPGFWSMSDAEVVALREYLVKGGFLIVDDFPANAWANFDLQMSRVFPQGRWKELTPKHPIFHSFFEIDSFDIIPQAYNLGARPAFYGLFEDNDESKRMYVIANYANDLSEFWEYVAQGYAPVSGTNEAYKLGINQFVYGLTH